MQYLFGTADARDVKRLAAVCDELHAFESRTVHAADHQLTYLRTLDEMTKQNVKDTLDLARKLLDSIRNFSLQLHRVETDLLDTQATIEKQVRYSAAIREIEMAILELKFSLMQLQESLDVTSSGKLSSVLINPYNLSTILQQVSLQLPADYLC
jgi:septal ring factor EnvC (AmiA/AmiB activator)